MSEPQTFLGYPVVFTDEMPKGEIIFGSLPTYEELLQSGMSLEQWVKANPTRFVKTTSLGDSLIPQNPVATVSDSVTLRREIDAITRQLHGLLERLKRVKATIPTN